MWGNRRLALVWCGFQLPTWPQNVGNLPTQFGCFVGSWAFLGCFCGHQAAFLMLAWFFLLPTFVGNLPTKKIPVGSWKA